MPDRRAKPVTIPISDLRDIQAAMAKVVTTLNLAVQEMDAAGLTEVEANVTTFMSRLRFKVNSAVGEIYSSVLRRVAHDRLLSHQPVKQSARDEHGSAGAKRGKR